MLCDNELQPIGYKEKMVSAFRTDDILAFESAIDTLSDAQAGEALHEICTSKLIKDEEKRCEFADKLLYRYNAHGIHPSAGSYPIHQAAKRGLHRLLAQLINHSINPADPTALTKNGETAIHSAIRGAASVSSLENQNFEIVEENALKCVKLLVEKNCNLFAKDGVADITAVHLAAQNELWSIVEFLLQNRANIDMKIDGKSARDYIEKYKPLWVESYTGCTYTGCSDSIMDTLDVLIEKLERHSVSVDNKENAFEEWLLKNVTSMELNKPYKGRYTLLECAIKNRLPRMAATLIDQGADPNTALFAAIKAGEQYFDLIESAGKKLDITKKLPGNSQLTVLHFAVHTDNMNTSVNVVESILKLAATQISDVKKWVNEEDYRGMTALHYAAKRRLNDIVEVLLKYGANIFAPDKFNSPVFLNMRPELIMQHLDDQIQCTDDSCMDCSHALVFDFNFLKVPKKNQEFSKASSKGYSSLNMGGAINDENGDIPSEPEMQTLRWMVDSKSHRIALQHPVIKAFLRIKWHRLFWFYWLNFAFYLAFTLTFFLFVFSIDFKNINNEDMVVAKNRTENVGFLHEHFDSVWNLLMVLTVFFALRELFQLVFLTKKYLLTLENWLEMTIIVMTVCLLHSPFTKWVASALCLLICIEMVLLMSRHPCLAIYIRMFFQVALNFLKFLLWYMCLIAAFGFSFYIIFPKCTPKEGVEDCKDFFNTLPDSIFKTIVMISGEYEAGDLEFNHVSIASHLIFLSFLFLISIVMVNLLNGLAVSDTQEIRNEAELIFCVSQVKFFYDIESVLLVSWKNCCCMILKPYTSWMGTKILLLDNLLAESGNKVHVFLNQNNRVEPDLNTCCRNECCTGCIGGSRPCRFSFCRTFNTIVSDALAVAHKNTEVDKMDLILTRLKKLEYMLEERSRN
ncbi:transient receptor potential channel pyrexia-like [Neocloeon triangulifer]|uniref:transient receptor potential channel pyrexia-like n=1 Tax=Neocloeon triangulifer TaxID=2078957 RepID=UPI00286EF060|nr:transient receptor potential channel pyrexia-like [Neocloeon triangulifer]